LLYYLSFAVSSFVNGLRQDPVDVVLCLSTPFFGGWSAWLLAKLKGARFVYDIFDLHPEASRNAELIRESSLVYRIWHMQDCLLCRVSDRILTLSATMRDEIIKRGIAPEMVKVIPLWIDTDKLCPLDRINDWRLSQGISSKLFVALYAGTIGHISGAEILVEVARLLGAEQDILILCVGEGPTKEELQRQAKVAGIQNVKFLPFQPEEDLALMQATADVGLVTLLPDAGRTSVPSKVLGYLAAGRAVVGSVATDSPTALAIREGNCGMVVQSIVRMREVMLRMYTVDWL
jgi:colanic acid biosynthesis glycosyl transferase WcaI